MTQRSQGQPSASQYGTSVVVRQDKAAKELDTILCKHREGWKYGDPVPNAVRNKRRAINAEECLPSKAVLMCLAENGRFEEWVSAARVFLNPGEITKEPPREIMLGVNSTLRLMGEHADDLLCGRADSEDYLALARYGHEVSQEFEQLSDAAAHQVYAAPALQRAS